MTSAYGLLFYVTGAMVLLLTGLAVTRRDPVHAAACLVGSFLGTGFLFYLLGAPLLAALEVIIFAGAIMVLFLFIVMTLNTGEDADRTARLRRWLVALVPCLVSAGCIGTLLLAVPAGRKLLAAATVRPADFGRFLFEHYWYPVEIVSALLFVALVGALYIGRKAPEKDGTAGEDAS